MDEGTSVLLEINAIVNQAAGPLDVLKHVLEQDVAERLSHHFADGRLDQAEFSARLDRATGAKTRRDLDGLFDDLPRLADEPSPPA